MDLPRVIGVIVQLSDVSVKVKSLSSPPGKHPNEILQKLGYKLKEIGNLRHEGIICYVKGVRL